MTAEPNLGDVLAALLDETDDISTPTDREYARDGLVFAARPSESVVELRLGAEIGEAAVRTPDTSPSTRGPEWVRFGPADWDEHAFDRLEAWFRVAWRLAGSRG
ncbi:MAG TPA: hypothetical protein VIK08_10200 [Candidatus Limnocylindrales bacterium]